MGDNVNQGPTSDTAAGDVVSITVAPDGPYGVHFIPDSEGFAAVIQSFDRLPNGKFGPLQKHGGLHYGDVLFEINSTPLANTTFAEAMKIVNDRNILKKVFKFVNSKEYYRRKLVYISKLYKYYCHLISFFLQENCEHTSTIARWKKQLSVNC